MHSHPTRGLRPPLCLGIWTCPGRPRPFPDYFPPRSRSSFEGVFVAASQRSRSRSPEFSQMALISSQLQWLEAELESAVDECGQVVEQNKAWLAETIQKNTKNLQYQTCARGPLG